jgi:hypothetical protein
MPSNSQFTINNFSPDFRDALLNRNLLADTVTNNSLSSWLDGINKIPDIGDGVGIIKGSGDIETEGVIYRKTNIKFSKINLNEYYTGIGITYPSVDVDFPNSLYSQYSTSPASSPTNDSVYWRDENTIFNIFKGGNPEYYGNSVISYTDTDIVTNTSYINNSLFSAQNNPETAALFRRNLSVTQNQYKADVYEKVSLDLLPFETNPALAILNLNPNTYAPSLETYTSTLVPASGPFQGGNIRQFNTGRNMYLDVDKQTTVDLNTTPVANIQYKSYLDENGNLNFGDTGSVQLADALGSALTGGGLGLDPNSGSVVPDFDVRSSLAGRLLTSTGALDDTRLGQISPQYLGMAIGNNIAFNLQEETLGRVNTNPLSLAMGGSLIVPNNKITVASTLLGKGAGFLEKITGAKIPVSLLGKDADIFSYNTKGYIEIGNIERANAILKNTGKGTVSYLFGNIKSNINPSLLGNRQGYAPAFDAGGNDQISDAKLYFLDKGDGMVQNILSQSEENSPIPQSSHNLSGIIDNYGFGAPGILDRDSKLRISSDSSYSKFVWGDKVWNKSTEEKSPFSTKLITNSTDKKSLLHKTQSLFNSGKIRTLISGKGKTVESFDNEITTSTKGFMSKGSAVLKNGGRGIDTDSSPDNIFARAWSQVDSYNTYDDLQKHSALSPEGRVDKDLNIEQSVLREAGVVQIGPYSDDNNIKRFMFSLENLAWSDSTTKLLPCEIGPGDPLTNRKGRIMWFPPYDIAINESVSASYDRTNFIGRGEPIYTYNNTERTGTLSWKIVVDHPNYLNFFRDGTDEDYASFFAGAMKIEEIQNRVLSEEEKEKLKIANASKRSNGVPKQIEPVFEFNVYYPNDVSDVPYKGSSPFFRGYENGYTNYNDKKNTLIDYSEYPTGIKYEQGTTNIEEVYGLKTTKRSHGSDSKEDTDNTNFGLNGPSNPINLSMSDIEELDGWYGFEDESEDSIIDYFKEGSCKYCKIELTGYASPHGDPAYNKGLSKSRGDKLKTYFVDVLEIDPGRIKVNTPVPIQESNSKCKADSAKDTIDCKKDRKVLVSVAYDAKLEKNDTSKPGRDPNEPDPKFTIPLSRFYTECNYFEKIEETDNFVYAQFKDKIKNFHPAFHAITPEGFNSRLTFLQQCMRQGPTNGSDNPDNLAFGKPPVCILRLGDFYHTKIIIESLTIDYEPIVWDLNPEGVGVQPMIANVNISFAFIGGSSMKGPINRLQNAISFNYFANTELYDPRAERIKDGKIVEGNFPYSEEVRLRLEAEKKNQAEIAEFEKNRLAKEESKKASIKAEEARLKALDNDKKILQNINIFEFNNLGEFGFDLTMMINTDEGLYEFPDDSVSGSGPQPESEGSKVLSREYYGELFITNSKTKKRTYIESSLIATPVDETSIKIGTQAIISDDIVIADEQFVNFDLKFPLFTLGSFHFKIINDSNFNTIMSELEPCTVTTLESQNPDSNTPDFLASDFESPYFEDENGVQSGVLYKVTRPCIEGDNTLTLKWTDNSGFNTFSQVVYLDNEKFSGINPNNP